MCLNGLAGQHVSGSLSIHGSGLREARVQENRCFILGNKEYGGDWLKGENQERQVGGEK